jgi:hypothetical protein
VLAVWIASPRSPRSHIAEEAARSIGASPWTVFAPSRCRSRCGADRERDLRVPESLDEFTGVFRRRAGRHDAAV